MSFEFIEKNLNDLKAKIAQESQLCQRELNSVQLLPVTKNHSLNKLEFLYSLGERQFAENRVQELNEKAAQMPADITWHLIGTLQSNKVKAALEFASVIHSVDSLKLLRRIDRIAAELGKKPSILLQVNISEEETKSGFKVDDIAEAVKTAEQLTEIRLIGFMTMAPAQASDKEIFQYFDQLRLIKEQYQSQNPEITQLSMGMSADFPTAIKAGSTCIRVGTAIMGERDY